jgi:hypothetical protein
MFPMSAELTAFMSYTPDLTEAVARQVACVRAKHPGVRFPAVKVMTEAMLLQSIALAEG